jgi:hypothetical protein
MTDREIDIMLWGAFLLASRAAALQNGQRDLGTREINALGMLVRQIAEGAATLEEPTELAAEEPGIGHLLMRVATVNIRNNRDLSQRILHGYTICTSEVQE